MSEMLSQCVVSTGRYVDVYARIYLDVRMCMCLCVLWSCSSTELHAFIPQGNNKGQAGTRPFGAGFAVANPLMMSPEPAVDLKATKRRQAAMPSAVRTVNPVKKVHRPKPPTTARPSSLNDDLDDGSGSTYVLPQSVHAVLENCVKVAAPWVTVPPAVLIPVPERQAS